MGRLTSKSLLKKDAKKTSGASCSEKTASTSPPVVADTSKAGIHHTPSYQSEIIVESKEESAVMRKIRERRESDMVPAKKGVVKLMEREHFGLLVNYGCIGFLNGLLPAIIYPFFKLYLNMASYQVTAANTIIMLPWSYKTLFGILTDHYPIWGYRRKSYILIGWLVCFVALMVLAYSPHVKPYYRSGEIQRTRNTLHRAVDNEEAPKAGARYLVELMFVCLGYVITDVACDGIMVELAQHEHIEVRGTAQSTIYMVRFSGNFAGGLVAALCFNGSEYGGTFKWSIQYETVFFTCAIITILGCVSTIFMLVEEPYCPEEDRYPFREMWRIIKQRAIWQMMAFHFLNSFFSNFGFSGFSAIQEYWVGVEPLNNSIATCASTFLCVAATFLMKMYFLNTSWRKLMLICSLFCICVSFSVGMIVTFDVLRNQWFFLGGPQLAVIPDGMRHVISGFVTVEIAEHGFEGATYSLLTTVHNLASPFAASMYNLVDAHFDVSDADIASDSDHVRWQVTYCLIRAGHADPWSLHDPSPPQPEARGPRAQVSRHLQSARRRTGTGGSGLRTGLGHDRQHAVDPELHGMPPHRGWPWLPLMRRMATLGWSNQMAVTHSASRSHSVVCPISDPTHPVC